MRVSGTHSACLEVSRRRDSIYARAKSLDPEEESISYGPMYRLRISRNPGYIENFCWLHALVQCMHKRCIHGEVIAVFRWTEPVYVLHDSLYLHRRSRASCSCEAGIYGVVVWYSGGCCRNAPVYWPLKLRLVIYGPVSRCMLTATDRTTSNTHYLGDHPKI